MLLTTLLEFTNLNGRMFEVLAADSTRLNFRLTRTQVLSDVRQTCN